MIKSLFLIIGLSVGIPALGAELNHARTLVDQQRYAEAIALYDVLLIEQSDQADLIIEAARVNAWADRHQPAAVLYQQAIAAAPHRRYDVLLALAWQLAWSGRHSEAIPLFQEVSQQVPAQKTEALLGLAESLSLSNRLTEALAVYRTVSGPPDNLQARLGEARMLLWLARHNEAAVTYRTITESHPEN